MPSDYIFRKLRTDKNIARLIRPVRRYLYARSYYRDKLKLIKVWAFTNAENSNFYYDLEDRNLEYLIHFISFALNTPFEVVSRYVDEILENDLLKIHIEEGMKNSNYREKIEIKYGRRIGWYVIARILKPNVVVETGVDHGIGSCILSEAIIRNRVEGFQGEYFGIDINEMSGQLLTGKYSKVGTILYGDSINTLGNFPKHIDLFINDSDHSASYEYREYKEINRLLSKSSIIIGDNCHATDSLARFSREEARKFIFFKEDPNNHWYPGAGIGLSI